MSKFDEALEKATTQLESCGVTVDQDFLKKVGKGLGPALYNLDASKVSFSDKGELETVKKNFLMKKLGLTDEAQADSAIETAKEKLSNAKIKLRLSVYYVLAKELNKEEIYA